jgi:3-hydroxyisobutyrate dehydrogenase-like beta-hydroxyacid dehydrogenase
MEEVGFIGLGLMGQPMAANLLKAGHRLTVYNRSPDKTRALLEQGARLAQRPQDVVATGAGIVVTMVGDDRALEEVTTGADGIGQRLGKDGVHVCMATVSPDIARRLQAWHAQRGSHYVAAPVFGRPPAAAAAKLWILCAGNQQAKARVQPLLQTMGQGVFDFGVDPGAANVVKVAGNFLISCMIEGMAEALTMGEKSGVDRQAMAECYVKALFPCPVYQNYAPMIVAGGAKDIGFALRLGLKDNDLVLAAAESAAAPMPFASVLHDRFVSAVGRGRGEADWTAIVANVAEDAGLGDRGR